MGLFVFSAIFSNHPDAVHAAKPKLEPVDMALVGCENWTRENNKLAVDKIVKEYVITGTKLPANQYLVVMDHRACASRVLMESRREYPGDRNDIALVNAEAGLK